MDTSTIIAAGAAITAAILGAYLTKVFNERQRERHHEPKIKITRIKHLQKQRKLLDSVWELYRERFPSDERTDPENIRRWIREGKKNAYFLVAYITGAKNIARGFFIFTYNPNEKFSFAFISYLAADKKTPKEFRTSIRHELCLEAEKILKNEIKDCKGLVAEMDDPSKLASNDKKRIKRAKSRIQRFKEVCGDGGFSFIEINNVDYKQPSLKPDGTQEDEIPLKLVFIPIQEGVNELNNEEIKNLVSSIYDVYGANYEYDETLNRQYKRYIRDLKARVLKTVS